MIEPTPRTARRTHGFTESVIREMTRVAAEHDALNLAQGFPDFPAPEALKVAAVEAIRRDVNQYAVTWGSPRIRRALGVAYHRWYGLEIEPDRQVTVTCGATEAMAGALLAVVDPGDEVIVLEPFAESRPPRAMTMANARGSRQRPLPQPPAAPEPRLPLSLPTALAPPRKGGAREDRGGPSH